MRLDYWPRGLLTKSLPLRTLWNSFKVNIPGKSLEGLKTETQKMHKGRDSPEILDACLHFLSFLTLYWLSLNKSFMLVCTIESGKSFQIPNWGKTHSFLTAVRYGNETLAGSITSSQIQEVRWLFFFTIVNKSNTIIIRQGSTPAPD